MCWFLIFRERIGRFLESYQTLLVTPGVSSTSTSADSIIVSKSISGTATGAAVDNLTLWLYCQPQPEHATARTHQSITHLSVHSIQPGNVKSCHVKSHPVSLLVLPVFCYFFLFLIMLSCHTGRRQYQHRYCPTYALIGASCFLKLSHYRTYVVSFRLPNFAWRSCFLFLLLFLLPFSPHLRYHRVQ